MISTSVLETVDIEEYSRESYTITDDICIDEDNDSDYINTTFQDWTQHIANRSRAKVESINRNM